MIDLVWDVFQQAQINNLKKGAASAREKDKYHDGKDLSLEIRFNELEKRHEQLKLVTLAMWSLLRDHSGLMESDLRKYVDDLDLMDGAKDGKIKMAKQKLKCSGCEREVLSRSLVCAYCGTTLHSGNPFRSA